MCPDLNAADVAQRAQKGFRSFTPWACIDYKTGSEPAILSLREETMRRLEVGSIPVESAPMSLKAAALWKMG